MFYASYNLDQRHKNLRTELSEEWYQTAAVTGKGTSPYEHERPVPTSPVGSGAEAGLDEAGGRCQAPQGARSPPGPLVSGFLPPQTWEGTEAVLVACI